MLSRAFFRRQGILYAAALPGLEGHATKVSLSATSPARKSSNAQERARSIFFQEFRKMADLIFITHANNCMDSKKILYLLNFCKHGVDSGAPIDSTQEQTRPSCYRQSPAVNWPRKAGRFGCSSQQLLFRWLGNWGAKMSDIVYGVLAAAAIGTLAAAGVLAKKRSVKVGLRLAIAGSERATSS